MNNINNENMNNINNNDDDNMRKFVCSSEYFSGFTVMINLTHMETIDDIVIYFKNSLINILQEHNFERLMELVNNRNFHIHSYTIGEILISSHDEIFYICDHC